MRMVDRRRLRSSNFLDEDVIRITLYLRMPFYQAKFIVINIVFIFSKIAVTIHDSICNI